MNGWYDIAGNYHSVDNLSWIRRYSAEVRSIEILLNAGPGAIAVFHMDGSNHRQFVTEFADATVLFDWLARPIFSDVPMTVIDPLGAVEESTPGQRRRPR